MLSSELKNVIGLDDQDLRSLELVAFSYIRQGKFDIALSLLEGLEVLEPENVYILQTLGACYLETKNPYKALDTLEKALKLDPYSETSRFNRIQALMSLGLKKQALIECEGMLNAQNKLLKDKAEALLLSELIV
jgi:predicted Zn-dependent protease